MIGDFSLPRLMTPHGVDALHPGNPKNIKRAKKNDLLAIHKSDIVSA